MTTVPTKIVLKSTTRMSLNDRFSNIAPSIQHIRANMAAEQQVSAANRRLAQQLANRPGLQNAGANMYQMQQQQQHRKQPLLNAPVNKKPLQQRLGRPFIKNRLSMPGSGGGQPLRGRGRGRGRGGGGGGAIQAGSGDNQWAGNKARGRGGLPQRGPRGRGAFRGRGRGRGTFNRFTGQNTLNRRGGGGGSGTRSSPRGMRRGGRGRGRGANTNVSVQDLDSQLDEYMARTKSHLDAELDAYMSEVSK